jgi:hypothetical protein
LSVFIYFICVTYLLNKILFSLPQLIYTSLTSVSTFSSEALSI